MSNVLTGEAKKILDGRAWTRFIAVGAAASVFAAFVGVIALLPAFISVRVARASLEAPSQAQQEAREDSATASHAQVLVNALQPLMSSTTPSESLAQALALQPAGISITSISYQSNPDTIKLSGISDDRDDVNAFRDVLASSGLFAGVEVPVAALVGAQEGRFIMTLTSKK